ncbi:MAG: hypothetical protein AMJ42_04140 [Deltaproteobacteria bacterium DG_8]|nr:MAG: hypothetical protein AMJ42_04140 [Deltaproteobacteria bacterium DG_8]
MDHLSSQDMIDDKKSLAKQSRRVIWFVGLLVFLVTFLVYTPALKNGFVNWDDTLYIVENEHIRSLDLQSLYWMFTTFHAGFWFPLTWFSHALDYALWGLDPGMHHLTNIVLHGLNTLLVFFLALGLFLRTKVNDGTLSSKINSVTSNQALIVGSVTALLFGLHPLRVESVAWATERKDLLCAFFVLLGLLSYLSYALSTHGKSHWFWFNISLFLFILALMSKPMAVTFPVVILLLDFYPLKRLSGNSPKKLSVMLEKTPFFILSIIFSVLAIITQKTGGAIRNLEELYFTARLLNALKAVVFYMIKMLWSTQLVPLYRLPSVINPLDLQYLLSGGVVLGITGMCLWMMREKKPLWLTAWLYYLVTLLPVIGIVQVGLHSAADRFTYLPSLSFSLIFGLSVTWIWNRISVSRQKVVFRGLVLFCIFVVISILGYLTINQIKIWRNSKTMWASVIQAFPDMVPEAYYGLGLFYYERGRLDEAISEFEHSIALSPNYAPAHYNLGNTYVRKGMLDKAISEFKRAIALGSNTADVHNNLGGCYGQKGRLDEAISEFKQAIDINPSFEDACVNLGLTYYKKGELDKAIYEYKKAISINANTARAHYNLAVVYYDKKYYQRAIKHCNRAVDLGYSVRKEFLDLLKPYRD